ncbi:alpha/beta hydrolase [Robbsia sp. KACC 23696]|uniref:RBBP9/YdeN family alpha/beta hydrolase n=1 Tax=Robbsia sp. KACC 23696 TaxID=3149231 RepID=UPI00325B16C0
MPSPHSVTPRIPGVAARSTFLDRAAPGRLDSAQRGRHGDGRTSTDALRDGKTAVTVLIVPGLHGSEDAHWQSCLERTMPSARRVIQRDWARPSLKEWSERVRAEIAIAAAESDAPIVLVGHSFGCLTIAAALLESGAACGDQGLDRVAAALLVAPANPARFDIDPSRLRAALPVTSVTVGSENDPWMPFDAVRQFAQAWGSSLINLGNAGHINVASGFGPWPLGLELTDMLCWQARRDASTATQRPTRDASLTHAA